MIRYLLYAIVGLAAAFAIAYSAAVQYGIDPFANEMAVYWAVIAMTGVYVTVRIAMILERRKKRQAHRPEDLRLSSRKRGAPQAKDSLDARMQARKERVRRAQERQAAAAPPEGAGEEDI